MRALISSLLFLSLVVTGGCQPEPELRAVLANATWADDASELLLIETQWMSTKPDVPHFNDSSGSDHEVVLFSAAPDLSGKTELLRFPTEEGPVGGTRGMLYQRAYWLRAAGKVIGREATNPFVRDLVSGARFDAVLPPADAAAFFGEAGADPSSLVVDYVPSPDGRTLAVVYKHTDTSSSEFRYTHAVAFFDLWRELSYLGGTSLEAWAGSRDKLRLIAPSPALWFNGPPEPDVIPIMGHQAIISTLQYLIWSKDSAGVFILAKGDVNLGEPNGGAFVPRTAPITPQPLGQSDLVPSLALATSHWAVSPTGQVVVISGDLGDVNAEITYSVHQDSAWIPFESVEEVPLSDVSEVF